MHRFFSFATLIALFAVTACGPTDRPLTSRPPTEPMPNGCVGSNDGMNNLIAEVSDGTGSTNGLSAATFQEYEGDLYKAASNAIYPENKLNADVASSDLWTTEKGKNVLHYAVQCAVPEGKMIGDLPGKGLLETTKNWLQCPLSESARADLYACMIAHVNPNLEEVPIFLSGPSVKQGPTSDDYPVEEALWTVTVGEIITYHVWPLATLPDCAKDGDDISEALKRRVCGHNAPVCNVKQHDFSDGSCVPVEPPVPGHFKCKVSPDSDYQPAIKTLLKLATPEKDDLTTLYCPAPG